MQFKYIELCFTMPQSAAATVLARQEAGEPSDDRVTFFSDEGGVVAAVNVSGDGMRDDHALTLGVDLAFDRLYELLDDEDVTLADPWSMKLVDRDRMAEYFHLVAKQEPMPQRGPVDDDGLAGVG